MPADVYAAYTTLPTVVHAAQLTDDNADDILRMANHSGASS
jgi:hypothetical protein